jgi:hypothetical protein
MTTNVSRLAGEVVPGVVGVRCGKLDPRYPPQRPTAYP